MIWIRLHTADLTNNPKAGNSCNLVNNRIVIMAGGCWGRGIGQCYNYGWNTLMYDIVEADWGWTYSNTTEGYFVPKQIHAVVGGE